MVRGWYIVLSICLAMVFALLYNLLFVNLAHEAPRPDKGVIDLEHVRFTDEVVVPLNGEWLFYNSASSPSLERHYIQVPSSWNVQDHHFLKHGYGTYQLEIRLHEQNVGETLGLYIPNAATAYEVWIDGTLQLSNGVIGNNANDVVPTNYARTLYFVPEQPRVDLTIHVANFSQRKGGLWDEIHLGTADAISLAREKKIALQLLVVGALLMMSIYLLNVYFLRRSQTSAFYLGLLTLLMATRTLLTGETFFVRVFPMFPWEMQVKIEYLTMILGVALFVRYSHHLYPEDRSPKVQTMADIVAALYSALVLLTPALIYTRYLIGYQIFMLPVVVYLIRLFTIAMIRQRTASRFNFICMLIFIAASLNDALFYLNFVNTGQFAPKGFFVFLLSQTFVHAIKYSSAFHNIERLSNELNRMNQSLEQKVDERTKELKKTNDRLQQVEQSRKALISDISHELSGPMTLIEGYVEAIVDRKIPSEQKYWAIIYDKTRLLKRLIHDLSALSELESRKIRMEFQKVQAAVFPEQTYGHFQGEMNAIGYELKWAGQDDWASSLPAGAYVVMDRDRIHQVLMNIILNAVKHSGAANSMTMAAEWVPVHTTVGEDGERHKVGDLGVRVTDTGSGISEHDLPHIFKRMYRGAGAKNTGDGSRGLGLAISKEIMDIHDGTIRAESDLQRGTTFSISLPVYIDQ